MEGPGRKWKAMFCMWRPLSQLEQFVKGKVSKMERDHPPQHEKISNPLKWETWMSIKGGSFLSFN